MASVVTTRGVYAAGADALFAKAADWADLKRVMEGAAVYRGLPDGPVVEGEEIEVDITWFGFLPGGVHHIRVARVDPEARRIEFRESNSTASRWDHDLTVAEEGKGAAWTDAVTLEAGWKTFLIARFASWMYRRRHRRRGALDIESERR